MVIIPYVMPGFDLARLCAKKLAAEAHAGAIGMVLLNYCMDFEYWLRIGRAGVCFAYLEEKLAGSRLYAENKTLGARVKVHREINDMFKKLFGRLPDRWLFNYAHAVVEQRSSRDGNATTFAIRVGVNSLLSALRWNGSISAAMCKAMFSWIRG